MFAQMPILFLALAAVIGVFIGLLLASLFSSRDSQQKKKASPEIVKEGFGEVARLWYSPAGKKIVTEMDGGIYKGFNDLSDDQKSKVFRLLDLWKEWAVDTKAVPDTTLHVMEKPAAGVLGSAAAAVEPVQPFKALEDEDEDVVSVLQQSLEEPDENQEVPIATSSAVNLSITEQISLILQDLLEGTELKEKGVKLIENENFGVDVWVGMEKYSGVESVPYPQVRQLIHEAVLRWENESDVQRRISE